MNGSFRVAVEVRRRIFKRGDCLLIPRPREQLPTWGQWFRFMERREVQEGFTRRRTMNRRKRSTFNVQRSTFNVQRSTFNAQRSTLNAQCSTLNAQRSMLNAQCSMLNAQCSMSKHHARSALLDSRRSAGVNRKRRAAQGRVGGPGRREAGSADYQAGTKVAEKMQAARLCCVVGGAYLLLASAR